MPEPPIGNTLDPMYLTRDAFMIDVVDDKWRVEKLPHEDVQIPTEHLPDPEADISEVQATLKELEQRWTDLNTAALRGSAD